MRNRVALKLKFAKNVVLAVAGIAASGSPIAVGVLHTPAVLAQSAASATAGSPARPAFEVVSIKLNLDCPGDHQDEQFSPGRVSVTCITLPNLIQAAYGTSASGPNSNPKRLRLFGAPDWMGSSRYNITAKAQGEAPMDQMFGPMLQVLLEDRFRLKVHRDTRELPVYTMTLAKGGLKILATREGSCIPLDLNHADQPSPNFCGRMTGKANGMHITDDAYGMSMAEIASRFLANRLDRPVIDKTGLAGLFDAHLEFARDNAVTTPINPGAPADTEAPSIFTAVQDQLGLKLSADKGPVEVLVIDHVEKPSEN
jgi:uncharacterized protein (TIGR03435 family)